jgi:hypothetical protein
MVRMTLFVSMAFAALAVAQNGDGTQFITGPCVSDADCASGCCSIDTEACAARLVAEEGSGCGFGGAGAGNNAGNDNNNNAGVEAPAAGAGTQFITGPCTSDADCASGCCSIDTEACAARLVAEEGSGCGFGGAGAGNNAGNDAADEAADGTGSGDGTQFITGPCFGDADCASGCCSVDTEACAARLVAEEGSGCGFGN